MSLLMPGPCKICGATQYELSLGGRDICPWCDCGDFGMARIQRQGKEMAKLREDIERLKRPLRLFTTHSCENFTTGIGSCFNNGRKVGAKYTSEAVCVPCVSYAVLNGQTI